MRKQTGIYVILGILFLFFPLVKHAHWESAFLITLIHLFVLLITVKKETTTRFSHDVVILGAIFPLLIADIWKGCFTVDGLAFWLLIPFPAFMLIRSVLGLAFRFTSKAKWITGFVVLGMSLGLPIVELLLTPIVRLYNPIWGFWPGPIYDEAISFPLELVMYRFYTFLWIFLLRSISSPVQDLRFIGLSFFGVALFFLSLRPAGIIQTRTDIQQKLPNSIHYPELVLFYDSRVTDSAEATFLAKQAVFHTRELVKQLKTTLPQPIEMYVYNHVWQKKEITGAKYTQYTPVWSSGYQVHVDKSSAAKVIRHELAHVVSKTLTPSILGASWRIGLTEGLATAADPFVSPRYTLHELAAAAKPEELASVETLFTFAGFYSEHSEKAYLLSGSFVQYLLENQPVESMKNWYSGESFEQAFGQDFAVSLDNWKTYLSSVPIDTSTVNEARQRFGQLSLFEKQCPRKRSREYEVVDFIRYLAAEKDTASYTSFITNQIDTDLSEDVNHYLKRLLAIEFIKENRLENAIDLLSKTDNPASKLVLSDALLLADTSTYTLPDSLEIWVQQHSNLRNNREKHRQFVTMYYLNRISEQVLATYPDLVGLAVAVLQENPTETGVELINSKISGLPTQTQFQWIEFLLQKRKIHMATDCLTSLENQSLLTIEQLQLEQLKRFIDFLKEQ